VIWAWFQAMGWILRARRVGHHDDLERLQAAGGGRQAGGFENALTFSCGTFLAGFIFLAA
jgi:hypothetical protein